MSRIAGQTLEDRYLRGSEAPLHSMSPDSNEFSTYSISSLVNHYYCFTLPTIEEEDVLQRDDRSDSVLVYDHESEAEEEEECEEDVERFWKGVVATIGNCTGVVEEWSGPRLEWEADSVLDHGMDVGEDHLEEDDMFLQVPIGVRNARSHVAEGNVISYFSSVSSIDQFEQSRDESDDELEEETPAEPGGSNGISTRSNSAEIHSIPPSTPSSKNKSFKARKLFMRSSPSLTSLGVFSSPASPPPPLPPLPSSLKKSRLFSPFTTLPKRLSESFSSKVSGSLNRSRLSRSSSLTKLRKSPKNQEPSPPSVPPLPLTPAPHATTSPTFQIPDQPLYTENQLFDSDSWTTSTAPSFRTSRNSTLSISSPLSSELSSPVSSPTSSSSFLARNSLTPFTFSTEESMMKIEESRHVDFELDWDLQVVEPKLGRKETFTVPDDRVDRFADVPRGIELDHPSDEYEGTQQEESSWNEWGRRSDEVEALKSTVPPLKIAKRKLRETYVLGRVDEY
ncbi:hypothetical protein K435DRAFT_390927 [Dendrothele bispora CBS 962.96]|uniref:Uncharacterized protein n=1 Tax=Dendrothele bispora (strain CBS 962.96) TaxID=1314807 RepID=A0A4V6T5K8_DENBC|nr:hypothetical protein K435DRAFT_390927 [Dendrothele bispora CBS 962.96]